MKRTNRKLSLDTSTIRNLTPQQLAKVAGGISSVRVWCSTDDTGCCDGNSGESSCACPTVSHY